MKAPNNLHSDKILILDFGSQYTQLIARRIREIGIYCEIWRGDCAPLAISQFAAQGIILSGGPASVTDSDTMRAPSVIWTLGVPILGLCYGMQTMVVQLGGAVAQSAKAEFGYAQIRAHNHSRLLSGIEDTQNEAGHGLLDVWMSHGDKVSKLPAGFMRIASTANTPIAAIADEKRGFYAVQFHPEVTHTTQGNAILQRFAVDICNCARLWTSSNIIDNSIKAITKQVGSDEVILGLSGGVDSSVVATLLHRAIGEQLTCVFVDTGLLRLDEGAQVMEMFAGKQGLKVIMVNAEQRYLSALKGVENPEKKRHIIGNLFVQIFQEEAAKLSAAKWLAQGTIYPDVIESAGGKNGKAQLIKSHHNVAGLPKDMHLKLLEPLRELFKDEVRTIGIELGLPPKMVHRHPFPGPGLGVRILGEVSQEFADLLRRADAILIEELYRHNLYDEVAQAFAVFLPVKSVGVMGDGRRYDYVIALRIVETSDFMTARWARLPYDFLDEVARRIVNEVAGISRVTYDICGKPPATIEWE